MAPQAFDRNTMRGIVWLASYPKSGNTWFRAFLTALLDDSGDGPIDINQLSYAANISGRRIFDDVLGWQTSDLPTQKIFRLGLAVQEHIAGLGRTYFKIHTAYRHPRNHELLVSPCATHRALYFIRNPLDVVVSLANHNGKDINSTIRLLNNVQGCLGGKRGMLQLPQPLGDWSWHARSWSESPKCHVMRYEDMLTAPEKIFGDGCRFAELPYTSAQIAKALERSRFDALQSQEKTKGFREKPSKSTQFFRFGRSGVWRNVLSAEQVKTIASVHGAMMRRFGYIDASGTPVS